MIDLPNDEVVIGVAEKVSAASQPGSVTIYSNLFHRQPVAENFTTLAYQQDDSIPTHPLKRERSNAEKCLPPKCFKKPKKSLRTCFNPTAKTQKAGNFFFKFHSFSVQGTGLHALLSPQIKSIPDVI